MKLIHRQRWQIFVCALACALSLSACAAAQTPNGNNPAANGNANPSAAQTATPQTPSDTVRAFYGAMRAKRFREAFALTVFKPAIDSLAPEDYEDLRPDFEALAANLPEKIDVKGEQISGDKATVLFKISAPDADPNAVPSEVNLRRAPTGAWIVLADDDQTEAAIRQYGKEYFFQLRMDTHHEEALAMLQRVIKAQLAYNAQSGGRYGDMAALVKAGLLPDDISSSVSTGYNYRVEVNNNGFGYQAWATPARYNRTGKFSFFLDQTGQLRREDNNGKPLAPNKK